MDVRRRVKNEEELFAKTMKALYAEFKVRSQIGAKRD